MEYYFERYGDLELQRRMVRDLVRTRAFAEALAEVVKKSDVVLDVGTGTGLLAMLAAKAGARRVYAIDQAAITQTAANLTKANGLEDRVRVFRGSAQELQLEQKVSLLVSEWLGNFAFVEAMLDDVLVARDKNLAAKGRMMPSHVELLLAPIDDAILYNQEGPGAWRNDVFGLDLTKLESLELAQGRAVQIKVEPGALLAPGESLFELDLGKAKSESPFRSGRLRFEPRRDGVLSAFCGWFRARLSPKVLLDTGPEHPETHWAQTYLPFPNRIVKAGKPIELEYELRRDDNERRHLQLELRFGRTRQTYILE